jgi:hypothetical protein
VASIAIFGVEPSAVLNVGARIVDQVANHRGILRESRATRQGDDQGDKKTAITQNNTRPRRQKG